MPQYQCWCSKFVLETGYELQRWIGLSFQDGTKLYHLTRYSCWRHQMETFSVLLALCAGNSPVTGEFPTRRPVTRSFDAFSDLCLNKRLSKHLCGWWFETPSCSLWRHCNGRFLDISTNFHTAFHFLISEQLPFLFSGATGMGTYWIPPTFSGNALIPPIHQVFGPIIFEVYSNEKI